MSPNSRNFHTRFPTHLLKRGIIGKLIKMFLFLNFLLLLNCSYLETDETEYNKKRIITVCERGKSSAEIVISHHATSQIHNAADTFKKYILKSTGASLPIVYRVSDDKLVHIHIGMSSYVKRMVPQINGLKNQGFMICFPDSKNIVIAGKDDWGSEFGVYEFLERYAGIKWLIPTELGEHITTYKDLIIRRKNIVQEPAFGSRYLSGLPNYSQELWARRNRMYGQNSAPHHNLFNIFPPEKYTFSHPEFFPVLDGRRYLPEKTERSGWQPCFTAPGLAKEAIKNICIYFDNNPGATYFSLSINDHEGHCECRRCLSKIADSGLNAYGYRNMSNLYFKWANEVAEGVIKKHPGKRFVCLAYNSIAEPPSDTKVNPNILPFIACDRMKWLDSENEMKGKTLHKKWQAVSTSIAWYDYIYGTPYCVPRVYFHLLARNYKYAQENGVQAIYSEAFPNWGEGPKLFIAQKLQWNPELDVDELLDEWYRYMVGSEAAPFLASYYELWEKFWTERIPNSQWFQTGETYHLFSKSAYLEYVTIDDLVKSRYYLESAISKSITNNQLLRAMALFEAYEYYEATVLNYLARKHILVKNIKSKKYAAAYLKKVEWCFELERRRKDIFERFNSSPLLIHPSRYDKFEDLRSFCADGIFRAYDTFQGPFGKDILMEALTNATNQDFKNNVKTLLDTILKSDLINRNPSFENITYPWNFWQKPKKGQFKLISKDYYSGNSSILCKGVENGAITQKIAIHPGKYTLLGHLKAVDDIVNSVRCEISLQLYDTNNKLLKHFTSSEANISKSWKSIGISADVPASYGKRKVKYALMLMALKGFQGSDSVLVDDLLLYRLQD